MGAVKCLCCAIFRKNSLNRYLLGKTIKIVHKIEYIKRVYTKLFFTWEYIFCLGICMSVSKPSICFWKRVISVKWMNKLLIHNINLTTWLHVVYSPWFSLRYETLLPFGIGGPRFFPRAAATMISKRFVKLGIIVYFWILWKVWSKDDSYII